MTRVAMLGLLAMSACNAQSGNNLPPTLQLDVEPTIEYVVGDGIVSITATAEDPEGGGVAVGLVDPPERSDLQEFDGWSVFHWDPLVSDVTPPDQPYQLVFFAEDEMGDRTEKVVNLEIVPGNGAPRFTSELTKLHNLESTAPVTFKVAVRDDDSTEVAIEMKADTAPQGATFTKTTEFSGTFEWQPTPDQLQRGNYNVAFVANDGQHPPVERNVKIMIRKPGNGDAARPEPISDPAGPTGCFFEDQVQHEALGPQRGSDDYRIEAVLGPEAAERYDRVVLNWTTADAFNQFDVEKTGVEMTLENGVYVGSIPNPLLPAGESKEHYYEICAIDDDSDEDDSVICAPSSVYYSFIAYSPETSECVDDAFVNRSFESALDITNVIGWEHHRGCGEASADYYRLDLEPQQDADIFFTYPFGKGVDIEMYDEEKNLLPIEPSSCSGFAYALIENATDQPMTRYFRVIANDVPYQLSPYLYEPRSTCVSSDIEPNDTTDEATPIAVDGSPEPEQQICGPSDVDVFEFFVNQGESIRSEIEFSHSEGDLDMYLYAPSLEVNVENGGLATAEAVSTTDDEVIEVVAAETGNYYLVVTPYQGESNTYTLSTKVEMPVGCTDADMFAGNHSQSSSQELLFQTHPGLQLCPGQDDWFHFLAFAGDDLTVTLRVTEGSASDVTMDLLLDGNVEQSATTSGNELEVDLYAAAQNEYHLRIGTTAAVTYELELDFAL